MNSFAVQSGQLTETPQTARQTVDAKGRTPIAWTDAHGKVWPHESGAALFDGVPYLYTREAVLAAVAAQDDIVVVTSGARPAPEVIQGTADAVAAAASAEPVTIPTPAVLAAQKLVMMSAFANPAGHAQQIA